ncbi:ankyrin repeat domain-containing protein 10 [Exaiptasia diaphana]|uniref:Ankyrin repeat domain-containing protein 10 n=1 Tax=Exaiptasia diaphana TaxID=2652724 RepID=A0A913XIF8_EXADI|nr:ankyrin repeat domain-containing protein 10 [Exaiptasia diaphana]KXJ25879.1 Ankyrin repeat domain-containing protein 10 [Exaiptasia diaphana]
MGSEACFPTKEQLDEQILRSPWAEYPLPPLHKACRDGDVQSLLYLVIQGDRLEVFRSVNEQDQFLMWTPAHWAAYFGQLECLMRLVSCGFSLDVVDGRLKQTTAHLAAFSGNALVLDWVLQAGATADKQDSLGETAVHKAVRGGSPECLNILQNYGAAMNSVNCNLQTPMDIAHLLKMEECLHFLKSLNGFICRPAKRPRDGDSMDEQAKRPRNESHNISVNVSVSSLITNGPMPDAGHQQKLLEMMEANGQYPVVDHSMAACMNTDMQHANHVQHNSVINGDIHMDHSSHHEPKTDTMSNQMPQRCLMLCSHFQ